MTSAPADLRERVRQVYSEIAKAPDAEHPVRVGRKVAVRAGYDEEWLSNAPRVSVEAFAGVSCVPCFAEIEATAHVLDLGCGAGLDSLLVAVQAGSVLGVDFSEAMLSRAETSARSMGLDNVEFRQGSAEAIPCETGSIDVALVNGLFNLNPARTEIFRELARVVHPGGLVFAAELILKQPLPEEARRSETDWFA
jgi:SAM-dependent methyltransferase